MKKLVRDRGAVAVAAGLLLYTSTGMALETKPTLTLDLAKKMAAACEAKAKQEKWLMNIAVVEVHQVGSIIDQVRFGLSG